ncbi:MAG: acyl-CoA reductase, partial [Bacteroidia bacterium]
MDPLILAGWGEVLRGMIADEALILNACRQNPWFVPANVRYALESLTPWCDAETLRAFASRYPKAQRELEIGLILAGNVPMVGFHDLLVVLLSGHRAALKPSSKDSVLIQELLRRSSSAVQERVELVEGIHPDAVDGIIATGSDQTAAVLDKLFAKLPRCIRHSRFSVGVLDGTEDAETLRDVASAVLMHHGMGCRSLSWLAVPQDWNPAGLVAALEAWDAGELAQGWSVAFRLARASEMMSASFLTDCSRIVLRKTRQLLPAPPACLNVHFLESEAELSSMLVSEQNRIQ